MPNTPKGLTYPSSSSPVAVPADIQELATDVDGLIVPNTGGTYTGSVSFTQPPSVPTPTSGLHAVNKTYADAINTDITALETELGTNPSGTFSTVVQRLDSYTDGFSKVGNLLTANQASIETDTTGWLAAADCTIARNAGVGGTHGAACLQATATSTADPVWWTTWITGIEAGDTYTAVMDIAATPNPAVIDYYIEWSDGSSTTGYAHAPAATAISASWTTMRATGVAPVTTTRARLVVIAANIAADDKFFCDRFGFWKGAGGVWALPGTPITGLSEQASNGAVHLSGTGTPEGVVTAAPGSTWLQTNSTADVKGWIRWVKATGTGNTGWIAGPEADSGWRNISALLDNSWAGTLYVCRVGQLIHLYGSLNGTSATSHLALASSPLPVGFRPRYNVERAIVRNASLSEAIFMELTSGGLMAMWSGNGDGAGQIVSETYLATNMYDWPSSLPGTAV